MHKNMGNTDRMIRTFVLAPVAFVLALVVGPGSVGGIVVFAIAGIMVGTAAVGFCPLYAPFGFKTCPRQATQTR